MHVIKHAHNRTTMEVRHGLFGAFLRMNKTFQIPGSQFESCRTQELTFKRNGRIRVGVVVTSRVLFRSNQMLCVRCAVESCHLLPVNLATDTLLEENRFQCFCWLIELSCVSLAKNIHSLLLPQ